MKRSLVTQPTSKIFSYLLLFFAAFLPYVSISQNAPAPPEFTNFSPVGNSGANVNPVTGALTFQATLLTVPGPNGGFPITLGYDSDNNQTSWVGNGWTLNPGAVTRSVNGFYDDAKGDTYKMWSKALPNETNTGGIGVGAEAFGLEIGNYPYWSYNTYHGFSLGYGASVSFYGLGFSVDKHDGKLELSGGLDVAGTLQMTGRIAAQRLRFNLGNRISMGTYNAGSSSLALLDRRRYGYAPLLSSYSGKSLSGRVQVQVNIIGQQVGEDNSVFMTWTRQTNQESRNFFVYGYNNYADAVDPVNHLMDYDLDTNEANGFVGPETEFLPQVVTGADIFNVTANGVGGSFRAYNPRHGVLRPNKTTSEVQIKNVGTDFHVLGSFGFGVQGGGGISKEIDGPIETAGIEEYQFAPYASLAELSSDTQPGVFYRFTDEFGSFSHGGQSGDPKRATLAPKNKNDYLIKVPGAIDTPGAGVSIPTRTSNIRVFTNKDYSELQLPLANGKSLPLGPAAVDFALENNLKRNLQNANSIGGIEITNEAGVTYAFHEPLYTKSELELTLNVFPGGTAESPVGSFVNKDVFHPAFHPDEHLFISGHEMSTPHANTFLLTGIIGPNYVDLKADGLTTDDIDAVAKFHYTSPEDYRYRFPERGFFYDPRRLTTKVDDIATFTSGVTQMAYLKKVETGTHEAIFYTSDAPRYEALENAVADKLSWSAVDPVTGRKHYQRLDRIELRQKNDDGTTTLLETVYFEYEDGARPADYVLKRFWKEVANVRDTRVMATTLKYEYPNENDFDEPTRVRFSDIVNYGSQLNQTPAWSGYNQDIWGDYEKNGHQRKLVAESWLDQTPDEDFDPAAWKLKTIQLPTGASIISQYEKRDYAYVQDQPARAYVSLQSNTITDFKYYLNTAELGIVDGEHEAYKDYLSHWLVDQKHSIPFKFLYSTLNDFEPTFDQCDAEWVEGFLTVSEVGLDDGGLYLVMGDGLNGPRSVCTELVQTELGGRLLKGRGNECYAQVFGLGSEPDENAFGAYAVSAYHQAFNKLQVIKVASNFCKQFSPQHSYVQLPVLAKKFGNGVRVKRLLSYGAGLEPGASHLYGNEFRYTTVDTDGRAISSGVAANEPASDNSLENIIDVEYETPAKFKDPVNVKWYFGNEKIRRTGPLLAHTFPTAHVYYGNVTTVSISADHPSYTVSKYFTPREFPVNVKFTELQKQVHMISPALRMSFSGELNEWYTQGFTSTSIEAAGLPVSSVTYQGIWNDGQSDRQLSSTEFEYFDGPVPVLSEDGAIVSKHLGVTSETVSFGRQSLKHYFNMGVNFDLTFGALFAIPGGFFQNMKEKFTMFTTTTVTSRKLFQKSVTSVVDGVTNKVENIAFDPLSGAVVLQKSPDSYDRMEHTGLQAPHDGNVTAETIPGHSIYTDLRPKSENERFNLKWLYNDVVLIKDGDDYSLKVKNDETSLVPCQLTSDAKLCPGDIIKIQVDENSEVYVLSDESVNGAFKMYAYAGASPAAYTTFPDGETAAQSAFVLRSGKLNALGSSVGSVQHYGAIREIKDSEKISAATTLVEMLTEAAAQFDKTTSFGAAQWPAGLRIKSGGECYPVSGMTINLSATRDFAIDCSPRQVNVTLDIKVPTGTIFEFDSNGFILYYLPGQAECPRKIECLQLCIDESFSQTQAGVLAASAVELSRDVPVKKGAAPEIETNPIQSGERNLRPVHSFAYVTNNVLDGNNLSAGDRNYSAGIFELSRFNFDLPHTNTANGWVEVNSIEEYSQSGDPIVTSNAIGVTSVQKSYPLNNLPFLVAQNAGENNVFFESFEPLHTIYDAEESEYTTPFSPFLLPAITNIVTDERSHTGKHSVKLLPSGMSTAELLWDGSEGKVDQMQMDAGVLIRGWIHSDDPNLDGKIKLVFGNGIKLDFQIKTAQRDWRLIELVISPTVLAANVALGQPLFNKIAITGASTPVYVDDLFVKAFESSAIGIVYDDFFRPIARFDNWGFAVIYTYAPDGSLLRKSIETADGIKPLEEQRMKFKGTLR